MNWRIFFIYLLVFVVSVLVTYGFFRLINWEISLEKIITGCLISLIFVVLVKKKKK